MAHWRAYHVFSKLNILAEVQLFFNYILERSTVHKKTVGFSEAQPWKSRSVLQDITQGKCVLPRDHGKFVTEKSCTSLRRGLDKTSRSYW